MKVKEYVRAAFGLVCGLAIGSAAMAGIVWNEQPPGAGSQIATAQVTAHSDPSQISAINGTLNSYVPACCSAVEYEIDIFKIAITDFASFSARTVSSNPFDDTALFLFDALGMGVYMNDDNPADLLSTLPAGDARGPSANGYYFLAVALGGYEAFDAVANALFDFGAFSDVRDGAAGAGPLASWSTQFVSFSEPQFAYSIELTGAAVAEVPEPASMALVMLALAGVGVARRKSA